MLLFKFLLSLSLCTIILIHAGFIEDKLFNGIVMHFDRLDGACRGKKVPYQTFLQGVKIVSTKILVANCTFNVKEEGFKKLMLNIVIERCRYKENLDTCEQYIKQPNIDYCKSIDPDNLITKKSPLYIPYVPPVKCPIKKGFYHAYNVTLDLTPFIFAKLDGWYWKVKYDVVSPENNRLVFCMQMHGYVTYNKSKNN